MLVTLYYLRLRTNKRTFIRSCLHEMNEKSITQVLDKVSEPILIVKRKHRVSMKPKFINKAAKKMLHHEFLQQKKRDIRKEKAQAS